ncbi:MAG: hypothetical protein PHV30_08855, partial [Candidatus Margulisbacteria bacterium]|nr:hypothetical protein [Candidatus Margulisiibacteriota bacterium]
MKKTIHTGLLILSLAITLAATGTRVDLRNDFLNSGFNARVIGLGNTGIISAEGPESAYFNPAILVKENINPILLSYNPYNFDQSYIYGFYKLPYKYRDTTFGIGVIMDVIGNIEYRTDKTDSPTITSITQQCFTVGLARRVEKNINVGFNLNFVLDNYSTEKSSLFYSLGYYSTAFTPYDLSLVMRYYNSDEYALSLGAKIPLPMDLTTYIVSDIFLSGTYNSVLMKYGVNYQLDPSIALQAGLNGDNLSLGLSFL